MLVAATRARLTSGALPAAVADLVAGGLTAVPRDPFTMGTPLVVKTSDDGWLVYSIGPDGEDDGGGRRGPPRRPRATTTSASGSGPDASPPDGHRKSRGPKDLCGAAIRGIRAWPGMPI